MPKLRKVIRGTLALAPGGAAAHTEDEIQQANSETMNVLAEILQVADDAQVEGRTSLVNHNAIVQAAGTLRRIANRLASIATARIVTPMPPLDPATEADRRRFRCDLPSASLMAGFFQQRREPDRAGRAASRDYKFARGNSAAARIIRLTIGRTGVRANRIVDSRATPQEMVTELHSMRRIEFLLSELNRNLHKFPAPPRCRHLGSRPRALSRNR